MVGMYIGVVAAFLCGGVIVACFWAIALQRRELLSLRATNAGLLLDCASLRKGIGEIQAANTSLADRATTCEDIARNALGREAATMMRPVVIRPEEALLMAQTIGAMLDRAKIN